jgi:hypothetical protein
MSASAGVLKSREHPLDIPGTKLQPPRTYRDAVLKLLAAAPPDGTPIAAIMEIPKVGSRDG